MKKSLRFLALAMAIGLMLAVFAGCSSNGGQPGNEQAPAQGTSEQAGDEVQTSQEVYEFDWMYSWGREFPPENDPIKPIIEKDTNTKINVIIPPMNEYAEKVQVTVAGGDYPELIQFMPGMDWKTLADQGAFIPIDDLLQYGPNLQKIIPKENWDLVKMSGQVWGVPLLNVLNPQQLWVRQDWIEELGIGDGWEDKLGSENFKTVDDFYSVLQAFKRNKNATYTGSGVWALSPLFGAFGVVPASDHYVEENGEIIRVMQHSRMKQALEWVHKLYAEGLIDPEIVTNKTEQVNNKAAQGSTGMAFYNWNLHFILDTQYNMKQLDPKAKWVPTNPPQGPDGYAYLESDRRSMDGVFLISSKAKDPKRLIQFLDYLIDGKGYELTHYGIEGMHYNKKPDGSIEFTEAGKAEWLEVYGKMRHIWDPLFWYGKYGEYAASLEDSATENPNLPNVAEGFTPGPVWKQYGADLNRYEGEMLLKFITGEEPLSKWDEYIKTTKDTYHVDDINKEIIDSLKADGRL
ncbi:extracellular solute-binding protein [Mahella australiensis]|uniref:Extracellular solute-binding protein family 1 n=1 Tax=Mahella australiensis (strain DSM 15567 / CIP 107919 / 50-1 BON) TaxID=697281 RepID=F3ZY21_MAHA5|nr:extracellular solute-binding protein [Mahella australiensis]AEE97717.1 extracellular solute-binding protein family 1 [Mahella australiensis 50-1 BON]